jgi:hypothetical protein
MVIFQIMGYAVAVSLVLFILFWFVYRVVISRRPVDPVIDPHTMPCMRPIPIPTQNRTPLMRLLVWFFNRRRWELMEDFVFVLNGWPELLIRKGFEFDGASIPRPFWTMLNPVGLLLIPALIHDCAYQYGRLEEKKNDGQIVPYRPEYWKTGKERRAWDRLFREVGTAVNGTPVIDWIAWLGVRIGGGCAWKNRRRQNRDIQI